MCVEHLTASHLLRRIVTGDYGPNSMQAYRSRYCAGCVSCSRYVLYASDNDLPWASTAIGSPLQAEGARKESQPFPRCAPPPCGTGCDRGHPRLPGGLRWPEVSEVSQIASLPGTLSRPWRRTSPTSCWSCWRQTVSACRTDPRLITALAGSGRLDRQPGYLDNRPRQRPP